MGKFLAKYKHEIILGVLICIYIVYFSFASILRYNNFYSGRFDLGNMDQVVWNTIHGRIFQASTDTGAIISRLSVHADFALILLAPFYLLWSDPRTLLMIQTCILASGGIFIFLLANEILKNKTLGLIFGFLFLMSPLVQYTNLYDFHAVTLATTLLIAAFYFFMKRKYLPMTIFLILSGFAKEEVWLIVAIFGFPLLFQKTKQTKLLGAGIIILSIAFFLCLMSYAIPHALGGGQHFALSYYSDFGTSPTQVVKNILVSPQKVISLLFEKSRLEYLKLIFMPVGFISLLSPAFLIFAIPDLAIDLLSNNSQLRQIYYQYTAPITPFILISAIFAVKKLMKWFPKLPNAYIALYLIIFTLLSAYFYGPLPGSQRPNIDMFTRPYPNNKIVENFLQSIPGKYSVAATNNLGAHLSHRQNIATIPMGINNSDLILFLLNDKTAQPSLPAQRGIANSLLRSGKYIKVFMLGDFVVLKKQGVLL